MKLEVAVVNNFFKEGFFGYGEIDDYKPFSLAHFLPIIIAILLIFIIYKKRNSIKTSKYENAIRLTIGMICLFAELGYFWRLLYTGSGDPRNPDLLRHLPLQICEWSCIFASIMLMNKNKYFYQYCVYVSLTLGIFPLIITNVISTTGPCYFRYYQYWTEHLMPIIGVFYMTFVHGFRPEMKGILFPIIFLVSMGLVAIQANLNIEYATYFYLNYAHYLIPFLPSNQYLMLLISILVEGFILFPLVYYIFNKIKRDNN